MVALLAIGHLVGTRQLADADQSVGQAGVAEYMISKDFARHAGEQVLFESRELLVSAPAYRAAIKDVLARVEAAGLVTQIQSPLDPRFANQISANGQAALLQFQITGTIADSATRVVPVLNAVNAAAAAHPGIQIAETGTASINKSVNDTVLRDLHQPLVRRDGAGQLGDAADRPCGWRGLLDVLRQTATREARGRSLPGSSSPERVRGPHLASSRSQNVR